MFGKKESNSSSPEAGAKHSGIIERVVRDGLAREEFCSFREYHEDIFAALKETDEQVFELIEQEHTRQSNTLQLVAAENRCSRGVLGALGSIVQSKTAEGYPGLRLHGGSEVMDDVERLAVERAKQVFGARYANVQIHSGTTANLIVITALLDKGDTILSLPSSQGGHFSHGSVDSITAKFFNVENYNLDEETFMLDYDAIEAKAREVRPKLIICGASVYSRIIDFERFREIADSVGAYLLADISHIAGLVSAGVHPSSIDAAHFTTTSTYKSGGPRGGLVLSGKDADMEISTAGRKVKLGELIDKSVFPGLQGTPYFNNIAGKAVFFKEMLSDEYKERQGRIVVNAEVLASCLIDLGYEIVSGGTDNHMMIVDTVKSIDGLNGTIACRCLEDCGVVVDRVELPFERPGSAVVGGLRLGTPIVTLNGMGPEEMKETAALFDEILRQIRITGECNYEMDEGFVEEMRGKIEGLCRRFSIR
ncbi:MAG: serine hydroxymethyltransferase [Planctomycetota bacterium]|jgi:glycine hydroxymethyltransferase